MADRELVTFGVFLGALGAWGLALYVLTRGAGRRVSLLAVAAIALFVVYLIGQAAAQRAADGPAAIAWQRATWWGAHGAIAAWLALVAALRAEESAPNGGSGTGGAVGAAALAAMAVAAAILIAAAGTASDAFFVWSSPTLSDGVWRGQPGPLYPLYGLAVLGGVVAAALLGGGAWLTSPPGTPVRARLGWLFAAGLLFTAGAVALVAYRFVGGTVDGLGFALLLVGTAVMGWNVARYGALVAGEVIGPDFVAFVVGQALVVALYGGFAWTVGLAVGHLDVVLIALLALMTTHVLAGNRTLWLDRALFGRLAGELGALSLRVARQPDPESALAEAQTTVDALVAARAERVAEDARARVPERRDDSDGVTGDASAGWAVVSAAEDATAGRADASLADDTSAPGAGAAPAADDRRARQPDPAVSGADGPAVAALEAGLRVPVEAALRRVNDLAFLSRSPLIEQLPWVAARPGTALDRGRALQQSLLDALEKLRPPGPRPLPGQAAASAPWLLYLSLLECCVEGRQIKEFDQRWHVSESTYHRTRRSATEALVRELAGRIVE